MPEASDADKARLEAAREQINKLMQRDAKVKDESDLHNKLIKQASGSPPVARGCSGSCAARWRRADPRWPALRTGLRRPPGAAEAARRTLATCGQLPASPCVVGLGRAGASRLTPL